MFIGEMLSTKLRDAVLAELKTWSGHVNGRYQKDELHENNSKHGLVMSMAATRKMSYMKITQKHIFSTVVSSLDMLKQSYNRVKTTQ